MNEKSEAMRLAAVLDDPRMVVFFEQRCKAAAELRRLHEENAELRRERDEARRTVREAHEAGTRLTAQRDALLEALKRALPHAEDSMARPELDIDILDARAAIQMVEEGK